MAQAPRHFPAQGSAHLQYAATIERIGLRLETNFRPND